jgi:transposase-like protein
MYPVLFLDTLRVNIRNGGTVVKKSVYLALAIRRLQSNRRRQKRAGGLKSEGLWIEQNEGAKFWLGIMNELKNRGVQDISD